MTIQLKPKQQTVPFSQLRPGDLFMVTSASGVFIRIVGIETLDYSVNTVQFNNGTVHLFHGDKLVLPVSNAVLTGEF